MKPKAFRSYKDMTTKDGDGEGDEWHLEHDGIIRGYVDTPGQVVRGMAVQIKKYKEYRTPPQNEGETKRRVQKE
jgi:hypothetical protein